MPTIVINSVPASFTSVTNGSFALTFLIPAGFTATAGSFTFNSNISGVVGIQTYSNTFTTPNSTNPSPNASNNGAYNSSCALVGVNISDINAAAGTNMAVGITFNSTSGAISQAVSLCQLNLTGTFGPVTTIPDPTWGYGYQVAAPNLGIGLGTPCGGVGISNSGPHASPAALTVEWNFGLYLTLSNFVLNIAYAGQSLTFAVDTSTNGSSWTTQYTGSIGSDHTGTFTNEEITYNFAANQTAPYMRISVIEVPQVAAPSLINISNFLLGDPSAIPIPTGGAYCSNTGTLTISGTLKYGTHSIPGVERENFPMTMFVKKCCTPVTKPCAHTNPQGPFGSACNPYPGSMYCSDGKISVINTTTDCNGAYSFTTDGAILAVAIALGTWIENPNFSCEATAIGCGGDPSSNATQPYIPDPATQAMMDHCGGGLFTADGVGTGTALTIGAMFPSATGGVSDGSNNGFYACSGQPLSFCFPCITTTGGVYAATASGISIVPPGSGNIVANTLSGSYSLNIFSGCGAAQGYLYFVKDGQYYEVIGAYTTYTDGCGKTATNLPTPSDTGFDWFQFVSVTLSNWTQDCNPPINTPFTGPLGGTLTVLPPTKTPRLHIDSNVYPTYDGKVPTLCPQNCPVFGLQVQPPCLGATPDRLQMDTYKSNVTIAWVTSGAALKTANCRQITQKETRTYGSELWEPAHTVEATNADDIGMVYLPNESVYLTYLLSGTPKYRLNKQLGTGSAWTAAASPSPSVARHSASCRGQDQAARIRALGTQSTDGVIEFSQCRDNTGAVWTSPTTVTSFAQGPYAGLIYTGNAYVVLFSLSPSTSHGIAGGIYVTQSTDGGATWSAPVFTGQAGGQVNGICKTSQGILTAVVLGNTGALGFFPTTIMTSHNNGVGWSGGTAFANIVPGLPKPPVISALNDNIYIAWVSGDTPQYVLSTDGGATFY